MGKNGVSQLITVSFMLGSYPWRPQYPTLLKFWLYPESGKYFDTINLANMFCLLPPSMTSQPQFTFTSRWTQETFIKLPTGNLKSLGIAWNLYRPDLNCIQVSPGAQVWHDISYILLTHLSRTNTEKGARKKGMGHCPTHSVRPAILAKFLKIIW